MLVSKAGVAESPQAAPVCWRRCLDTSFLLFENVPPASLNPELDGELLEGRVGRASLSVPPCSPMCGLQCLLKNKPVRESVVAWKRLTPGMLGPTPKWAPDVALWGLRVGAEVSLAFMILQLVEIRTGEDPTGQPAPSPAGGALFPAGSSVAVGGIALHDYYFFFTLSSAKCVLHGTALYPSNKMHNRPYISG